MQLRLYKESIHSIIEIGHARINVNMSILNDRMSGLALFDGKEEE